MKKKQQTQNSIDANIKLNIGNQDCEISFSVPEGKSGPDAVLPFARELTNKVVDTAVNDFLKDDKTISCEKGCGACCVQLVPITDIEAREIATLIKSLPKVKKREIREKFELAKKTFTEAGLWQTLSHPENVDDDNVRELGHEYFAQQVACPFLEDGACSIHPVRPLACREFLVTSPAVYCQKPNENDVVTVDIPSRISNALGRLGEHDPHYVSRWLPLIVAPFWQALHPNQPIKKTGPEWIEELLGYIKD